MVSKRGVNQSFYASLGWLEPKTNLDQSSCLFIEIMLQNRHKKLSQRGARSSV